jgi:hypothetical protein
MGVEESQQQDSASANACPSCGKALPPRAVLCVACGYHLKLGHHMAMTEEDQPPPTESDNPYASPASLEMTAATPRGAPLVSDLTQYGAERAESVANAAESLTLTAIIALCICSPLWLVVLPWSAYQYSQWLQLNACFEELRRPNSLSPHGAVAVRFHAARRQLLAGIILGAMAWIIFGLVFVSRLFRVVPPR